jgi:diguanylate cyclase
MDISQSWSTHFSQQSDSLIVDNKRRRYCFLACCYVGVLVLIIFSIRDYGLLGNNISIVTSITAAAVLANLLLYHFKHCLALCCVFVSLFIIGFCLALVYLGGVENTALYWVFPFPMIIFILLGCFWGCLANVLFYLFLVVILLTPDILLAQYSIVEVIRFLASLAVLNAFSFINEFFREQSHTTMADINTNRELQANTDILTRLPNRRFVDAVFFPASKVSNGTAFPMVLIMADVDHFKKLNDSYGHKAGDIVLEAIARTMENCVRSDDIIARIGGEEFLLIFSNTHYDLGMKIAEKIRANVERMSIAFEDKILSVTMSFGVALTQKHKDIAATIEIADSKLYQAKKFGRNHVC